MYDENSDWSFEFVRKKVKKFVVILLIGGVLLLGGIGFGGDEEIISSLESINPEKKL